MTAEVTDQLCGVAMLLQTGSLHKSSVIYYGEESKVLILGQFWLDGFEGLLFCEIKT